MAGSPQSLWDKPAQVLRNPDGSIYMGRVISQPGDTTFVQPNFVPMNSPTYPIYRNEFNKHWKNPKKMETGGEVEKKKDFDSHYSGTFNTYNGFRNLKRKNSKFLK